MGDAIRRPVCHGLETLTINADGQSDPNDSGSDEFVQMHKNGGRGSIGQTSMHSIVNQSMKNRDLPYCRKRRSSSPCQAQSSRLDETKPARN